MRNGIPIMRTDWITPDWSAPAQVRAASTTRNGGVSSGPYTSLNLGEHVGDVADAVNENWRRVREALKLSQAPHWLHQVHGAQVVQLDSDTHTKSANQAPTGDAAVTGRAGTVCAIMTADCLPVLLCDKAGTVVAAAHGGWRSLAAGVLENTVRAMQVPAGQLMAWLGPAIGPEVYEVGDEVMEAFVDKDVHATAAFRHKPNGKWLCDLYALARIRLVALGVTQIHGGGFCTFTERDRFFSYRRDGACGRMGTLIWLAR
ncbi:MAG TPA: peptidoglycan editing factor PgeF [Gammaproteobacteria bacterium]|nr:peptidoglycan editing factor PgeF [Gammaproteobacteria bacterium]